MSGFTQNPVSWGSMSVSPSFALMVSWNGQLISMPLASISRIVSI